MRKVLARIEIQLLMHLTASAFGERPLRVWHRPRGEALSAYAACTRDWMKSTAKEPDALRRDMYRKSLRMGRLLRGLTFFLGDAGHTRLVFALYKGIGIDMRGALPGSIEVRSCYFSSYYTPGMCALISAMDDGIVSGIMGGGRLTFARRITEGCGCCRANLTRSESHEE